MPAVQIRQASLADAPHLAHHRAAMFLDMRELDPADAEPLRSATEAWLARAMPAGDYVGWVACDEAGTVVGGAGIQLRALLPRPVPGRRGVLAGRQGLIVNVFVDPGYRRMGVARDLTLRALAWARDEGLASVVLHASPAGRPLYERLGFVATNEMRFAGPWP